MKIAKREQIPQTSNIYLQVMVLQLVKKSITKAELFDMTFKDTKRHELRYRITEDGELQFLLSFIPKKGKGKTIVWPIKDLEVGTHPIFAIDEIEKGKLAKLKPKEVTANFGILKIKW